MLAVSAWFCSRQRQGLFTSTPRPDCGAHSPCLSAGTRSSYFGDNTGCAWSWPLISI